MRVFSYGGGVQSNAALVLAAQGKLEADAFLFANVGDDSERKRTLSYVREIAMPYAEKWAIPLIELGQLHDETLYGRVMAGKRGIVIPAHLKGSGPMRRQCTHDFKIAVINRWLRQHGATAKRPAVVMLGISTNEEIRAAKEHPGPKYRRIEYPLLAPGVRMSRMDCANVILGAGLPLPAKSSCYFCPWHTDQAWRELRDEEPEDFERACGIEDHISEWSRKRGHRPLYLSGRQIPLRVLVGSETQPSLFDEPCESGYCMT